MTLTTAEPTSTASPLPRVSPLPRLDRYFWLAVLLAALVLVPRSYLISRAHSASNDDTYHIRRGLFYLTEKPAGLIIVANDPPLGQALLSLPMVLTGSLPEKPIHPETTPDRWSTAPTTAAATDNTSPAATFARAGRREILFGHALPPETLLLLIAVWKSLLFLPAAAVVFQWCRALYGLPAAWLGLALVLVDPTFAAHVPIAALDTLGAEAVLLACFTIWCYVRNPSTPRLVLASFACAFAMLVKHTAVILPAVAIAYAILEWYVRPRLHRRTTASPSSVLIRDNPRPPAPNPHLPLRAALNRLALAALLTCLFIFALMKFDYSPPADRADPIHRPPGAAFSLTADVLYPALQRPWPAGRYIANLMVGFQTNAGGRNAYLLGQRWVGAAWGYFPIVAAHKIPLPLFVIAVLALLSFRRVPFRFEETSLLLPAACFTAFIIASRLNIGFRHFLPALIFLYPLAARALAQGIADCRLPIADSSPAAEGRTRDETGATAAAVVGPACAQSQSAIGNRQSKIPTLLATLALLASLLQTLTFHPDYLSFMNFPRYKPWLHVADASIDWGQGLKQVGQWLDAHPTSRPVYVRYSWGFGSRWVEYHLGPRVHHLDVYDAPPTTGLLILCPAWEVGLWDPLDTYGYLRPVPPIDVIGHAMPVYDLDQLAREGRLPHKDPPVPSAPQ